MQKRKFLRNRKPLIYLLFEGRNETEYLYFSHFLLRENKFVLKLVRCEVTDIKRIYNKGIKIAKDNDLDNKLGDRVICVVDIDLNPSKYNLVNLFRNKKSKFHIDFIISNPCFEIWLLFHLTKNPKVLNSSQLVKKELQRCVPNYIESYDIYEKENLDLKVARKNVQEKNNQYKDILELDRNPYTEVDKVFDLFDELNK